MITITSLIRGNNDNNNIYTKSLISNYDDNNNINFPRAAAG